MARFVALVGALAMVTAAVGSAPFGAATGKAAARQAEIDVDGGYGYELAVGGPLSASVDDRTAPGRIVGWGDDLMDQVSGAPTGSEFTAIAAGDMHSLALRADGSIVDWGSNDFGQVTDTPTGTGFTAIAAGHSHNLALRSDGSIVAWGNDVVGEVSETPTEKGFTAIAAGMFHSLALSADGTIVVWGDSSQELDAPTGAGFTEITAGCWHNLALAGDGSVTAWGDEAVIGPEVSETPTERGFESIAAGCYNSMALTADGSIVTWGGDDFGQVTDTPTGTGFIAIDIGAFDGMALTADGSIVTWGADSQVVNPPSGTSYTAIAAGGFHGLALWLTDSNGVEPQVVCPRPGTIVPFADWAAASESHRHDITCVYELDVTTGTSATTYSPLDDVTRQQMASFLARLYWSITGSEAPAVAVPFLDMDTASVSHRDDIARIYGLGITTGTSPTTYSPLELVSRQQMASFLARLYASATSSAATVVAVPFDDLSTGSSTHWDDIARIYGLDITTGTSATTYSPLDNVTRQQMASFLARLYRAT